tara:strand:- start:77 stop:400 length:324 start_codon:yes stop_codon:yes gene_type:complete
MSDNFDELLNKKYHKYAWAFAKDYIIYDNAYKKYKNMKNNKINRYISYYMDKGYIYNTSLSLSYNITNKDIDLQSKWKEIEYKKEKVKYIEEFYNYYYNYYTCNNNN